ncbi:MAG: DUF1659 domain-containing protein [Bacillota bacterium]
MAVVVTPVGSTLRLQVQTGTDPQGGPVLANRTFNRLKPTAADQDVMDIAQILADLQDYPLHAVQRVNELDLSAA